MSSSIFNRKGSHAGRGFRYQDAVGVWLALAAWDHQIPYGEVVPEGLDDFELKGDGLAFVQAKSRRDGLGPFSSASAIGFIEALWQRHEAAPVKPDELILVLERDVASWASAGNALLGRALTAADLAGSRLTGHPKCAALMAKTRLVVQDAPLEQSVSRLSNSLGCPPLTAEVYYGELLRRIGRLSDDNGLVTTGFAGLALSDTVQTIEDLRAHIALEDTPEALAAGLCEPIDFVTPFDDPLFYLGVDVRPGHLAAGLVAERPGPRQRILEALETQSAALVAGPSGAGKSALMWEAARASRHAVRWFKVNRLQPEDVAALLRLSRAMRASQRAPVGFIFDDLGRGLTGGWDALLRQVRGGEIVLLGSIREEDTFLLTARASAVEIRELGDESLAERIWTSLRESGQTDWAGWREPWAQSHGLLLEYAHLLSHGERLDKVLGEQVDRRLRERRFEELDILALVALAGAAGVGLDAAGLPAVLGQPAGEVALALTRLIDEHLVRQDARGRLEGLHPLRSESLSRHIHAKPPMSVSTSAERLVSLLQVTDLERFIGRTLMAYPEMLDTMVATIRTRLAVSTDPAVLAAGLHGLGEAHIVKSVRRWLPETERLGVPPTQVTSAALFGIAGSASQMPDIEELRTVMDAARLLSKEAADDPRTQLLSSLSDDLAASTLAKAQAPELVRILGGLIDGPSAAIVLKAVRELRPDLDALDLPTLVSLLETAQFLDPATAKAWVTTYGQEKLLDRLHRETPWSTKVSLRDDGGVRVVTGDILYVAAGAQPDIHAEVVRFCEMMLAFAPDAERADAQALGADGTPSGLPELPLAVKTIPRENLPPGVLPEWNRRWAAVIASEVATLSQTAYLATARDIMSRLVPILEKTFDDYLRGKARDPDLRKLEGILVELQQLTPPRMSGTGGAETYVTPLQGLLFDSTLELLRRFNKASDNAALFLLWSKSLAERLPAARAEPWSLIGGEPTDLFERLTFLIETVRLVAGEAGARAVHPQDGWRKRIQASRKGNALRSVGLDVRAALQRRLEAVAKTIEAAVPEARTHARIDMEQLTGWPPCEILTVIPLSALSDWQDVWPGVWEAMLAVTPDNAEHFLAPRIGGYVIGSLTMHGMQNPFPAFSAADKWIAEAGYKLLDEQCASAWAATLDALVASDGIQRFDLGLAGRPAVEIEALKSALATLEEGLARVRPLVEAQAPEGFAGFSQFVDDVREKRVALSVDIAALQKGVMSKTITDLGVLNTTALACDLLAAIGTGPSPNADETIGDL